MTAIYIWYYVSKWKQIKIQINVPRFLQLVYITKKAGIDRAMKEYIVCCWNLSGHLSYRSLWELGSTN